MAQREKEVYGMLNLCSKSFFVWILVPQSLASQPHPVPSERWTLIIYSGSLVILRKTINTLYATHHS